MEEENEDEVPSGWVGRIGWGRLGFSGGRWGLDKGVKRTGRGPKRLRAGLWPGTIRPCTIILI